MPKIIHTLLTLTLIALAIPAAAQEPGIYVNGDWKSSTLYASNINKTGNSITSEDVIDVVLSSNRSLSIESVAHINTGTWTFHGNGNEIPITCTAENAKLDIKESSVTFENCYIADMRFSVSNASVTFTDDCTVNGATFSFEQGESTITFTSGSYSDLSAEVNSSALFVIAGGTFHDCSDFFSAGTVVLAEGIMLCDPDSDEPLTIDSSGRIVDADGNPASAFTICEDTADPVISYTTRTGQSGTFSSVNAAVKYFANTKNDMHVDLTLLADVTANGRLCFDGMDATLNLGSHRITFDNEPGGGSSYHFVCVNGDLTLNADEGGGMDFNVTAPEGSSFFGLGVIAGATMTITSGSYQGSGLIVISYGTVNISGGTFHSIDQPAAYWREGEANISGGRFTTSNNKWAAIYSNGKSLVDGYSYWIHDYSGAPAETYDIYKSYFGGYVYNIFDNHAGRDVSVGEQSTFARLTANGISARYTNLAKAFEDAQKYESATITLEGGNLIGCREPVVIEGGNITFDYGKRTTLFTFNCDEPTITITGGTLTVRGDEDEYWCESSDLLFWVTDSGTLNVESGEYVSIGGSALYAPGEDTHINISGGILYSRSPDHCTVDLRSKHANITGGIFYNADGYCSLYSSEPCMSDELSFYYEGSIDPENELSFTPGDYLVTLNGSPVYYAVVAPSTGPRFTVTVHDGTQTTTQQFYSMEKALAFATEHESAHIDAHQHDYKKGAYRMAKGNVTIDLHGNYINSLYDIYFSNEPQFSDYLQHTVDYGAIVVSGGHLTINADNSNSWNIYSDVGCIVATGTSTIELNGVNTWSDLGIDIVASGRSTINVWGGSHHANYTIQSLTDSRYGSATVAAINEGYISIFDGTFEGLNTLYSDNSGEHDDDDYGSIYGSNISVYGGRFKGLAHRPAVTLHDGLLLCGGRYSCDSGQSAIAYPGERIYESWWNFIGEGYPPRDYYSGERLEMVVDRNDNGRVVFYTDSTQTAYANDIYLSMKPIFQIQHLTHIIDEAKKGRASISDVESMVQKVLKN